MSLDDSNYGRVVAHNPIWDEQYNKYVKDIGNILIKKIPSFHIEHVGATSVKGAFARPIITILIGLDSPMYMPVARDLLVTNGLKYASNVSTMGDMYLAKFSNQYDDRMLYNVHIVITNSREWKIYIAFRNLLKRDPDLLKQYNALRVINYSREEKKYNAIKSEFINKTLFPKK